jgi:hypothetical protein
MYLFLQKIICHVNLPCGGIQKRLPFGAVISLERRKDSPPSCSMQYLCSGISVLLMLIFDSVSLEMPRCVRIYVIETVSISSRCLEFRR